MQVVESLSQVSSKFLQSGFRQLLVLFDKLEKVTTSAVLKDNPQMVPSFIPVVEFEDMSVLQIVKDSHLYKLDQESGECSRTNLNQQSDRIRNIVLVTSKQLTSFRTLRRRNFSTDLTATYSTVFFLRPCIRNQIRSCFSKYRWLTYFVNDRVFAATDLLVNVEIVHIWKWYKSIDWLC